MKLAFYEEDNDFYPELYVKGKVFVLTDKKYQDCTLFSCTVYLVEENNKLYIRDFDSRKGNKRYKEIPIQKNSFLWCQLLTRKNFPEYYL